MKTDIIKKFKLPNYIKGKSASEGAKLIEDTFKDRKDAYAEESKKTLLQRLAQAQEYIKAKSNSSQPDQNQMEEGGFDEWMGENGEAAFGAATAGLDMVNTAFGPSGIDTSGNTAMHADDVKVGSGVASGALKGAQAGAGLGAPGMIIGGVLGAGASLLGGGEAKKDARKAQKNSEYKANSGYSSDFALGGTMGGDCGGPGQPPCKDFSYARNSKINEEDLNQLTIPAVKPDNYFAKDSIGNLKHLTAQERGYDPLLREKNLALKAAGKPIIGAKPMIEPGAFKNTLMKNPAASLNTIKDVISYKYGGKMQNRYEKGGPDDPDALVEGLPVGGAPDYDPGKPLRPIATSIEGAKAGLYNPELKFEPINTEKSTIASTEKGKEKGKGYDYANLLRYAPAIGNALQLAKMKKPKMETLDRLDARYKPSMVDEATLSNKIENEYGDIGSAVASASGGSSSAARANMLGTMSNKAKAKSDAYLKASEINRGELGKAQQFNLGVDSANLRQSNVEKDIRARDKGAFETNKSRLASQLAEDIGNIGLEEMRKKYPERMGFMYNSKGEYIGRIDDGGKFVSANNEKKKA